MTLVLPNNPQAQEIERQKQRIQQGAMLHEQLILAIYTALAGRQSIYEIQDQSDRARELEKCADRAVEAADVMCARFGVRVKRLNQPPAAETTPRAWPPSGQ